MLALNKWQLLQLHLKGPQCCELGMPDLQIMSVLSQMWI